MDIVITHPDGESHKGFLPKFVKRLKDINFLRGDLVFSVHSEEGTDSGVDTYFGLCTYPDRELRHRTDFKVVILCGGPYRRGKAFCGDMDIVITHPNGESHNGLLPKFVKRLKDINFLREDLVFSVHSEEIQELTLTLAYVLILIESCDIV